MVGNSTNGTLACDGDTLTVFVKLKKRSTIRYQVEPRFTIYLPRKAFVGRVGINSGLPGQTKTPFTVKTNNPNKLCVVRWISLLSYDTQLLPSQVSTASSYFFQPVNTGTIPTMSMTTVYKCDQSPHASSMEIDISNVTKGSLQIAEVKVMGVFANEKCIKPGNNA